MSPVGLILVKTRTAISHKLHCKKLGSPDWNRVVSVSGAAGNLLTDPDDLSEYQVDDVPLHPKRRSGKRKQKPRKRKSTQQERIQQCTAIIRGTYKEVDLTVDPDEGKQTTLGYVDQPTLVVEGPPQATGSATYATMEEAFMVQVSNLPKTRVRGRRS